MLRLLTHFARLITFDANDLHFVSIFLANDENNILRRGWPDCDFGCKTCLFYVVSRMIEPFKTFGCNYNFGFYDGSFLIRQFLATIYISQDVCLFKRS